MGAVRVFGAGESPLVFALAGSEALGRSIAERANAMLAPHEEREFERGEHKARPLATVRNRDVAIVHAVHGDLGGPTANDRLVRLWLFTAAVRDAGARSITVVVPYLPYSRKDRRTKARDPVGSRYVAEHFEVSGADRIVTVEPHNLAAFENAYRIEAIALPLAPLVVDWVAARAPDGPLAVVSPDVGGTKRAQQLQELLARRLNLAPGLAFVEKRRSGGELRTGLLVGQVAGAHCLLVDDLVSSGSTLASAADACRAAGARSVTVAAAHALFLPPAAHTLAGANFAQLLVTDSVPAAPACAAALPLVVLPLGPYLGEALRRIWSGESVSELAGIEA